MNRQLDPTTDPARFDRLRSRMVARDVAGRGVTDPRVLVAMGEVHRERFVPSRWVDAAYEDRPLPIGAGQTISQPFIVALMAESAEIGENDRVLEVGSGSGYGAAVLAGLGREVWTIERHRSLVEQATRNLQAEGFDNVHVVEGDGTLGWESAAPFDAVVVTAGAPTVPDPLLEQLADGGRLIMPVGRTDQTQMLVRLRRIGDRFIEEDLGAVRFVPLIGS